MYIENIQSPKDIKELGIKELKTVAEEIRDAILNRVSTHGGHVGPNLGFVEATIALHYVFNAPKDKFIFDISHLSYPHKILTGRVKGFIHNANVHAISGYSSPTESPEYDNFEVGHTSTSVSLATGLQKARDLQGSTENIVAVIGDGSLSGGEAFEGLDEATELNTGIIVIVNDNEMSIAENHGGIYRNLALLRQTQGKAEHNYFKALGFDYIYLEEGNDIQSLIETFSKVKDIDHPIVVHIHTEKGHGYKFATENKEKWHYSMPFDRNTGELLHTHPGESYNSILKDLLVEEAQKDSMVTIVTSGVPGALGFDPTTREQLGKQFEDVGIAEEQAIAMISGMAKGGAKPVYFTSATFLQRTYDQITQDLCVNGNPAVINVLGSSIYGMNDITHVCFFDIAMLSHIPNLVYLAPTSAEELVAMERWAIHQSEYSVAIRVPVYGRLHSDIPVSEDYSQINTYQTVRQGSGVAIIGAGDFFCKAEEIADLLQEHGIDATLINPRFLSGTDEKLLESLHATHRLVVTLEDGTLDGGFGERIARFYAPTAMRVKNYGVRKQLYDRYAMEDILRENHLNNPQIVSEIIELYGTL